MFLLLAPLICGVSLDGNESALSTPSAASHLVAESNTSAASKSVDLLLSPPLLFALVPAPHIATAANYLLLLRFSFLPDPFV